MKTIISLAMVFALVCLAGIILWALSKYVYLNYFNVSWAYTFEIVSILILIWALYLATIRITEYQPKKKLPSIPEPLDEDPYKDDKKNHFTGADTI